MSPKLEQLVSKYGSPGRMGRGVLVSHGGIEVDHNGRRISLPGPAGAAYVKEANHPHADLIAQMIAHPVRWHVGEKQLPIVKHYGMDDLTRMAWGEPGAQLSVGPRNEDRHSEEFTTGVFGNGVSANRAFDPKHGIVKHIAVRNLEKPAGWGTKKFLQAINTYRRHGFKKVKIESAAGPDVGKDWNGHYVWPRLGFNGFIHPIAMKNMPERFQHAHTLHALFNMPGGPEAWKEHGLTVDDLSFDLKPGSEHMKRLLAYLRAKRAQRL